MKSILKFSYLLLIVAMVVSCKSKGDKAETSEAAEVVTTSGKDYSVIATDSKLMWEGTKVTGTHNGIVDVKSGKVVMNDGKLTGGDFEIDMTTITVLDLEGDNKGYLESHLKGMGDDNADDFFNVKAYPTAKFEITKATQLEGDANANYIISGNLTIKDVTKQISFKAQVDASNDMIQVTTPQFTIDRTEWGIKYGSATFFDDLKDKAINNEFGLKVNLTAKA